METLTPVLLKHHLLTDDEAFICQFSYLSRGIKAQYLLLCLQRKGRKTLHKLLCCINKEKKHSGHKDLAAKLKDTMKSYNFEDELVCSVCEPSTEPSTYCQPDVFEDVFDVICTNYPAEEWEELASKLGFKEHDLVQMRSLAINTQPVTMVLQQWREVNSQATKEDFVTLLHKSRCASLGSVLQLFQNM